jgi:hypothetical protein
VGHLPNFDEDVFISYAHNDDDLYAQEPWGWVTRLHQDLEQRVRNYVGSDIKFWRDCEIRNNDDFTKKILNRLVRTATFLSVISPSFLQRDWCKRELEAFASRAQNDMGLLVDDERSRIFKVEKMPVERSALPPAMQGTKTYRFYEADPAQPKRVHELRPLLGGEYYRRYFEEMDELAKDIAALLRDMAQKTSSSGTDAKTDRLVVYVAETTSDLDSKVRELRRDLKDRGYVVLPAGDLPYRAAEYKDEVRECIKQAALSVHLVGEQYGFVPEGETKSNVWLQHDLAMERAGNPGFCQLIWSPRGLSPSDERQGHFIKYLNEDAAVQKGADLLNMNIEELKTIIHEKLATIGRQRKSLQQQPAGVAAASASAPDEPLRVYIMCDVGDRKLPALIALRKYLLDHGCEPVLPTQSADGGTALQVHAENLALCDACIIFYAGGSAEWFEAKLRDLRKYLRGRQPPIAAKAIYVAPPSNEHKNELETLEAMVMRDGDAFSPDVIAPFMRKMSATAEGT